MTNAEIKKGASIASIKSIVIKAGNNVSKRFIKDGYYNRNRYELDCDLNGMANEVVRIIAEGDYGFASQVAQSVMKFGRISEKQAYVISRAAFENEIDYIFGEKLVDEYFRDADFDEYLYEEEEEESAEEPAERPAERPAEANDDEEAAKEVADKVYTTRGAYAHTYKGLDKVAAMRFAGDVRKLYHRATGKKIKSSLSVENGNIVITFRR